VKRIFICVLAFSTLSVLGYTQVMNKPASVIRFVKKVAVYEEGQGTFIPSGWMGDFKAISVDPKCKVKPKNGTYCIKWTYDIAKSTKEGWAGVYWQYPQNNWGTRKGMDLTGHKKLSFWVRGETGKEVINITIGGIKGEHPDTFIREMKGIKLSSAWKQYTIALTGRDLSNVSGGFCWTADSRQNKGEVVFYFDDIIYD